MKQTLLEKLLDYYQITYEDYLSLTKDVTYLDIPSPTCFANIDKAKELVEKHLSLNNKIVIYGDYDADGISGCSILVKGFQYLGFKANYYIPSRYLDGYGLNVKKAEEIITKKYNLVICVDNGISCHEAIDLLRQNNIDVLVIDHHEPSETLPNANVIIHPFFSSFKVTTSGAMTAFMFMSHLLNRFDKYLALLASISLISDMMPMKEQNRTLLKLMSKEYQPGEFLPIDLLLDGEPFNYFTIGMFLAPKINAIGRVDKSTNINRLIKYFTSEDKEEVLSYKEWIYQLNDLRKEKSKQAKEEIIDNLKEVNEPAIIKEVDLDEGLLGLVANSLMNQFNVPTIVLTKDSNDENVLKGSARSIEGFNLADALNKLEEYELTHGGHALAAGVSLRRENLEIFKEKFYELVKSSTIVVKEKKAIDISINDINEESYYLIDSFSPFGEEWKAPLLKVKHIKANSFMFSRSQEHIITSISMKSKIVGFNYSKDYISNFNYVDIFGSLALKEYHSSKYVEFSISDLKES